MTIHEVFKRASFTGKFPQVKVDTPVRHYKSKYGNITVIRPTGVAVRFDDMPHDTWFWEERREDERSRYMDQLTFNPA